MTHFADGETLCEPINSIRGMNCYVIQSTCKPVNERLMEILIFADALKRGSAKSITMVMPYFGYARQDRKNKPRQPITSRLVADLIYAASINRVVVVDLHTPQIQGFFTCLVDEVQPFHIFDKVCIQLSYFSLTWQHGSRKLKF